MSDIAARVSLHQDLTTNSVIEALKKRQARSPAIQPGEVSPSLAPYRAAAAVLHVFDPARLNPLGGGPAGAPPEIGLISASAVGYINRLLRSLSIEQRNAALDAFADREQIRDALASNPDREMTVVQGLFEAWLNDRLDIEALSYSELEALGQLYDWRIERLGPLPSRAATEAARARRASVALFEHLVDASFVGRNNELQTLRDYVGVVSPSVWSRLRSFLFSGPVAPLVLVGPGGVGKTALIGHFLIEHVNAPALGWFPFAYLPFDTQTLDVREPWTLLSVASEQLEAQAMPGQDSKAANAKVKAAFAAFRAAVGEYRDERANLNSRTAPVPSQKGRFERSGRAHDLLYDRFAEMLHALADRSGLQQDASQVPVVLVLDTFEEVVFRTDEDLEGLWRMLTRIQVGFPALRVIISGRSPPRPFSVGGRAPHTLPLGDLNEADADTMLERLGVKDRPVRQGIIRQVGRSPLTLKLAARAAEDVTLTASGFEGLRPKRSFLMNVAPEIVRGQLYRRILNHIHDPQVRALAHPGMALRRVTAELILRVLAPVCALESGAVPKEEWADQLFEELRREHTLVRLDDDLSLRYREEVRTPMLRLLAADKPTLVERLHREAADYYESLPDAGPVERAEELYHLMMLGEPVEELEPRWMDGVERYLGSAVEEIPDEQKVWLASHMSIELTPDVYARADVQAWERLIGRRALEAARYSDPRQVLDLLAERAERSPESPLFAIEMRARMSLGEEDQDECRRALELGQRVIGDWPMNNLGRLAEIIWLSAQAAQLTGEQDTARALLRDLVELAGRLSSALPGIQALTELVAVTEGEERDVVRGDLATRLNEVSFEEVDRERPLIRLACVRMGAEHADVVRRLLPAIMRDLFWRFRQDPSTVAKAWPAVVAALADAAEEQWQSLYRQALAAPDSDEARQSLFDQVLEAASQSPSDAGMQAALAILAAEEADLRAAGLAGLDEYRESFELGGALESVA
ncbi:MAG TPA: hypothetical protein VGV07_02775 [Devosia sp.]|jgi:hypothetical protein|uniref:hypothetical protein n=1 Tax=Devosia sp. TaxID=1871048 RepID=UPI002DDD49C7|nr:hypothetical protein [Devosia sp.]HEV2514149.1 hypothetical protein [Devosia sp.]